MQPLLYGHQGGARQGPIIRSPPHWRRDLRRDEDRAGETVRRQGHACDAGQHQALEYRLTEIESSLGRKLTWYSKDDIRACQIYTRKEANLNDRIKWPEYHQWLANELNDFHRVFSPIVRNLEP